MPGFRGCQIHLADPEFRINHSRSIGEWNGVWRTNWRRTNFCPDSMLKLRDLREKGVDIMILLEFLASFVSLGKIINGKYNKFNNK